ncbi:MAG: amidohydrolase family protein [bacterium]
MAEEKPPLCPGPDPDTREPKHKVPPGACDAHAHIFGPEDKYPLSPKRGYTPPLCPLADYFRLHDILGIERGVLIQASAYGVDNSSIMDALASAGDRLRAVTAVDSSVSDAALERMNEAGVRGIRINLADPGGNPFGSFGEIGKMAERIKGLGWHMEFLLHVNDFPDLKKTFLSLPVDSVFGHLGYMPAAAGLDHPGFREFLDLIREGRAWVKLTAPNRITALERPPYTDVDPYGRALVETNSDRMLWGSDWPHVYFFKFIPNDADLLDQLAVWAPDEEIRKKILVDNPAALYGF